VPNYLAAVIDMWRQNLGVEVRVRQLEPEVYFYDIKREKNEMFNAGWVADYPDPQNFLDILFRPGSKGNDSEYSDPEVDALLNKAAGEGNTSARMEMYREAEQLLVERAACLPLWFGKNYLLVKPYVKNYIISPLGIPPLSKVRIESH
jgi:oligopeptide transport system substrate-binding protein